MEVQNAKIIEEAKKCVGTGNRAKALTLLKVKKLKEKQIEDINGQLLTVFNMIDRIEWESINVKAMEALKDGTRLIVAVSYACLSQASYCPLRIHWHHLAGTAALNSLHEQMSAEDIEDLLLESQESIEVRAHTATLLRSCNCTQSPAHAHAHALPRCLSDGEQNLRPNCRQLHRRGGRGR